MIWSVEVHPTKPNIVYCGATWQDIKVGEYSPLTYCRDVIV